MSRHITIIVLSLAAAFLMAGVGMIVALLPQRVYAATGTLESVSLIASLFAISYLAAQVPVGLLSDRYGAKPFLVAGYCLCGIAGLVFLAPQSAESIYLGRLIQGAGEAPIWALGPAVLSLAYPRSKGRVIGIYNAAVHAGLTLGPLLGLLAAPTGEGNRPFAVFALLCFAGAAMIVLFLPHGLRADRAETHARVSPRQFLHGANKRRFAAILAGILLYGACYGAFVSVLPVTLSISNGFDGRATGILFVIFYAALSVSQLVAGPLCDRFGRDRFMVAGLALAATGMGMFTLLPGLWAYGPLALASLGLGVFCVASLAELNDSVPAGVKGTVSGSYYLAWALGYVFGAPGIGASGAIASGLGYQLLAAALLAQAVAIWKTRPT